jgi:hypothetical protein
MRYAVIIVWQQVSTTHTIWQILDLFKGYRRVELCKEILGVFGKHAETTNDAILIHTLFDIARTLHDSVDSLSPEGEQRHVSSLICGFISKVDFGRDLEQQLNIYVECRAAFSNLDPVKVLFTGLRPMFVTHARCCIGQAYYLCL